MRTDDDIHEGKIERWNIPGLESREDGVCFLGDHVFCVQRGFAPPKVVENAVRLIVTCFNSNITRLSDELAEGGLSWDFIVAVYRGEDVSDVVAACIMVYGRCETRQYFYVFDVSTHPSMVRRGLGKVVMNAVFSLGCVIVQNRMCDYWQGILGLNDPLWLLLDVDMEKTRLIAPEHLIHMYSGLGYVSSASSSSIVIAPLEAWQKRWAWCIPYEPLTRCQMWLEVKPENKDKHSVAISEKVLAELCGNGVKLIASRFEWLMRKYPDIFMVA
jgi:hypothetical protein